MQAVAGTHTVLLVFDLDDPTGCLGFAIHRTDHTENEARWLRGMKTFETLVPDPPPGSDWATNVHPVQGFQWGDYAAKPGHDYTYAVSAVSGSASAPASAHPASAITTPGVQYPHCDPWHSTIARCTGCGSFPQASPSTVTTSAASSWNRNRMHESTGTYRIEFPTGRPTRTVQAPQSPSAHTTFVPVSPSRSRRYSDRVPNTVSPRTVCGRPFRKNRR